MNQTTNRRNKSEHRKKIASKNLTGFAKRHPDGFGFFIPDDVNVPDVYIPRNEMSGVMSNDRLQISVTPEPGGQRFRGEVLKIIERSTSRVVGKFEPHGSGKGILRDQSGAWGADLIVDTQALEVRSGDLIVVQITSYPDEAQGFRGKALTVIGDAEDPLNDSLRVLYSNGIPYEFSEASLKQAAAIPNEVTEKDMRGRKDLRELHFVTIDGKTAKDFDDAIYVEARPQGFRLWVAIADVSHYVKPGSPIDKDAYLRGTSTYFPRFVAPMLPEKLSNNLCSLNPHVPRLALVAEMDIDRQGEMQRYDFYEAVIQSHARVTYGEAQELIEGRCPPQLRKVEEDILLAKDLAKILMNKRFNDGSLNLELPETEIEINDLGQPVDILQVERLFSHRLIEELMLSANVAVAKFLGGKNVGALYRIHESPDPDAIEILGGFLHAFGYQKMVRGNEIAKKLTAALQHFQGHPKEYVLNMLALRSMAQAKYSPDNVGHFGLGFSDYAHFTSPIRRYPDLIIHRQVKAVLYPDRYPIADDENLESAGTFLSACEQRSVKAERQIKAIKKARFMAQFLGEEFEGTISSIAKFGFFVVLRQYDVDGLVRLDALPGGPFEYDEESMRLMNPRTGFGYSVGDNVKIQVAAASTNEGQIDFTLAGVKAPPRREGAPQYAKGKKHGKKEDRHRRKGKDKKNKKEFKFDKSGKTAKSTQPERFERSEKSSRSDGSERPERFERADKSERYRRPGRTGTPRQEEGSPSGSRASAGRAPAGRAKTLAEWVDKNLKSRSAPERLAFGKPKKKTGKSSSSPNSGPRRFKKLKGKKR